MMSGRWRAHLQNLRPPLLLLYTSRRDRGSGWCDTPDNEAYRDASLVHGMSTTLLPKLLVTWRMRAQPASPQSMPNRMQNADLLLIAYRTVLIVIRLAFVINLSGVC